MRGPRVVLRTKDCPSTFLDNTIFFYNNPAYHDAHISSKLLVSAADAILV